MRRADFSSCQCAARVREPYAPSTAFAQPNAHDSADNDARSTHARAKATGIIHFVCARVAYTAGSVQKVARHAPLDNGQGDISFHPSCRKEDPKLTSCSSACLTDESER